MQTDRPRKAIKWGSYRNITRKRLAIYPVQILENIEFDSMRYCISSAFISHQFVGIAMLRENYKFQPKL
jgi:hypothetical protein